MARAIYELRGRTVLIPARRGASAARRPASKSHGEPTSPLLDVDDERLKEVAKELGDGAWWQRAMLPTSR